MALSSSHLQSILKREPSTSRYFIGVFPSCLVNPSIFPRKKQFCFITNTDNHERGGDHWNGFYIRDGVLYFFDSFGRSPRDMTLPHSYRDILLNFKRVEYFNKQIQPFDSFTCGYYCIHFLILFSMGLNFKHLEEEFNFENRQENDLHVLNVIDSIL